MSLKKYFIILIMLYLGASSCKKSFLDVPDKSAVIREEFVTDIATTEQYLNGIYIILAQKFFSQGYLQIYPELIADNIKPVALTSPYLQPHYNWDQMALEASDVDINMDITWLNGYLITRSCSFVIEKANEFRSKNPSKADNIKGQAYALRALIYFNLVNIFSQPYNFTADGSHSGIPYITDHDWTQPVSGRETVAKVYNNLIDDLKTAAQLLPTNTTSTLFINLTAAKALLTRIYLFKGDYHNAKNIASEICILKPIMTGSNYPSNLFTLKETEALFQLPPSWSGVSGGTYSNFFQGIYFAAPLLRFIATDDIASILTEDMQDARKSWVTQQNSGVWYITKYPKNIVSGFPAGTQAYYPTILRSSEMYLTAAEAYAKLNNEDSARFYLDAIRMRANTSALPTTATGSALLDSIYKERRKELAFEGFRMFDMLRWEKPVNRIDAWNPAAQTLPYPSNKAIAPIPLKEITLSGLQQNPDY